MYPNQVSEGSTRANIPMGAQPTPRRTIDSAIGDQRTELMGLHEVIEHFESRLEPILELPEPNAGLQGTNKLDSRPSYLTLIDDNTGAVQAARVRLSRLMGRLQL